MFDAFHNQSPLITMVFASLMTYLIMCVCVCVFFLDWGSFDLPNLLCLTTTPITFDLKVKLASRFITWFCKHFTSFHC